MADMNPGRSRYVLVGHQRSGTHLLGSLLRSVPDVFHYDEVLVPTYVGNYAGEGLFFTYFRQAVKEDWGNLLITDYTVVDRLFNEFFKQTSESASASIVGYDIKIDQLNCFPRLFGSLPSWGFKIIHLVRQDYLARVISHQVMIERVAAGEKLIHKIKQGPIRLRVDIERTIGWMLSDRAANQHVESIFSTFAGRYLKLAYEDLSSANRDREVMRALRFVGSRYDGPLSTDTIKQATEPLSDVVENYSELVQEISYRRLVDLLPVAA